MFSILTILFYDRSYEQLAIILETLPEHMKAEVSEFVDLLIKKASGNEKPKFGSGKGMFKMAPDFDDPLEDFKENM